jgi:hypothetical protein
MNGTDEGKGQMRIFRLLVLALVAACYNSAEPNFSALLSEAVAAGEPFQLHIGQGAVVTELDGTVRFVEVVSDSRCPSNALILCVWEGEGVVAVETTPTVGETRTDTLRTQITFRTVELGDWVLELQDLAPYPETTEPIPVSEYIATFMVRPRE